MLASPIFQPECHLELVSRTSKWLKDVCVFRGGLLFLRLWAHLCCCSWSGPEEAQSLGLWDDLGQREGLEPIHSSESQSLCSVCLSPAARAGLFLLPLYYFDSQRWAWLHKSGGNTSPSLLSPCASCQIPHHHHHPFLWFYADLSQEAPSLVWCWSFSASVFVGRMIRTTPLSRLKALASPCQPAERLQ